MSKMKTKFKYHPNNCQDAWIYVDRYIDNRWYNSRLLDLDRVCSKCSKLKACTVSVLIKEV